MSGGRLIAIEGLDKAGKETQARLLQKNLLQLGHHAEVLSFPIYDGPLSLEIVRCVENKAVYPATVVQLLFSAQRLFYEPVISGWLRAGHIVIIDRYSDSALAYGMARGLNRKWLEMVEQPMPRPFLRIFLDVPPEVSLHRAVTPQDSFESDRLLLEKVYDIYRTLIAETPNEWAVVDGRQTVTKVESAVLDVVQKRLEKT